MSAQRKPPKRPRSTWVISLGYTRPAERQSYAPAPSCSKAARVANNSGNADRPCHRVWADLLGRTAFLMGAPRSLQSSLPLTFNAANTAF